MLNVLGKERFTLRNPWNKKQVPMPEVRKQKKCREKQGLGNWQELEVKKG